MNLWLKAHIPCSGVRVGIPGLLFNPQSSFGQDGAEPARNVHAYVVDLMGVLTHPTWSICVGLILKDLHPTSFTAALFSALFLQVKQKKKGTVMTWNSVYIYTFYIDLKEVIRWVAAGFLECKLKSTSTCFSPDHIKKSFEGPSQRTYAGDVLRS